VAKVELGHHVTVPASWRNELETLGLDFEQLQEEYKAWKQSEREALVKKLA